jgi:hypothetical protein
MPQTLTHQQTGAAAPGPADALFLPTMSYVVATADAAIDMCVRRD